MQLEPATTAKTSSTSKPPLQLATLPTLLTALKPPENAQLAILSVPLAKEPDLLTAHHALPTLKLARALHHSAAIVFLDMDSILLAELAFKESLLALEPSSSLVS